MPWDPGEARDPAEEGSHRQYHGVPREEDDGQRNAGGENDPGD